MGWSSLGRYKKEAYGCEHFDLKLLQDFINEYGITHFDYVNSRHDFPEVWKLHLDHAMFFRNKNTNQVILTSQLYDVSEQHKENINEYCEKYKLKYKIFEKLKSWYGRDTYLVVISKEVK